jgi:predicted aldo/keto reductase-like oxidoreductase
MQYRKFGKLDWKVSALGFGAMRLPLLDNTPSNVDEDEAIRMIRYAIDHGVNYLDTAYFYHAGRSEVVVGKALQGGYREKTRLATKLPAILIESAKDFDRYFDEQTERLQTYPDFYLLHGLNKNLWRRIRDLGVIKWAEDIMKKGYIRYLGFSFHDDLNAFKEIIDAYNNWTFCQIQYNYIDKNFQAGTKGLKYAADKGLAVVVMEPLRGGGLTVEPPEEVANLWACASKKRSQAEWGLLWVWNQPEVSVALSGMNKMEQVEENVAIAERSGIGVLTSEELQLIDKVAAAYRGLNPIPCTNCQYCMPCPNGVEIPRIFALYNDVFVYNSLNDSRIRYSDGRGITKEQRADNCIECGECEEKCPQGIPIREWLKKAHELLDTSG